MSNELQQLLDRQQVIDTIYRYASSNDDKDYVTLRATFVDDAVAQYAGAPEIHGADTIVKWIEEMCVDKAWQHHLLSVYHVDFDGPDEASTLTYHTSHQRTFEDPDTVLVIVARYTHRLRRVGGAWKIADLRMFVGWMEERQYPQGLMLEKEAEINLAAQARTGDEG